MMPRMFYFGPWDRPGHYMHAEPGEPWSLDRARWLSDFTERNPWGFAVDGGLCPNGSIRMRRPEQEIEGEALVHHKDGWTALAFWDRTVDKRGACCSVYLAEGIFTFEQMVEMAKERFSHRWNKMNFEVKACIDGQPDRLSQITEESRGPCTT